jgi:hypothetical protein
MMLKQQLYAIHCIIGILTPCPTAKNAPREHCIVVESGDEWLPETNTHG